MSKYFFTGGTMPSQNMFLYCKNKFNLENEWIINGKHYGKTSQHWIENLEANKEKVLELFKKDGKEDPELYYSMWWIFFQSLIECFNYNDGEEWFVSYYLFAK